MSSDLYSRATEISFSSGKRNIAIAEIILFSLVHIIQIPVRYMQEWRYWHHNKKQHPARCFVYSWWSMVGLLAQSEFPIPPIKESAANKYTGSTHRWRSNGAIDLPPKLRSADCRVGHAKHRFVTALVRSQSRTFEMVFPRSYMVVAKCSLANDFRRSGQAGEYGPGKSKHSKTMRFMLHFFRFPIFIAIVLAIVGGCIDIRPLGEAGSVVLVVTFAFVCGLVVWLAIKTRSALPVAGHRGVLLVLLALPFLLVRIVYFLLLEYGPARFNPASGNVGALAGMGLTMEVFLVFILLVARAIIEPIWPAGNSRLVGINDEEASEN